MAITTLDGVIAGMQPPEEFLKVGAGTQVVGRMYSPFYVTGRPGAAVAPTPGLSGAALTTYAGQLPFTNGAADQYLARFAAQSLTTGTGNGWPRFSRSSLRSCRTWVGINDEAERRFDRRRPPNLRWT